MKKIISIVLMMLFLIPGVIKAEEKDLNIYLFYGDGCPHCAALEEFFDEYISEHDNVKLHEYEVWYNEDNQKKLEEVQKILDYDASGIPYLVIGNNALVGFSKDSSEEKVINTINYYLNVDYTDKVGEYLGVVKPNNTKPGNDNKYTSNIVDLPILGKTDIKSTSIGLSAIVIGLVDGFNPCAMWILIFLISMLLGTKDRKRMWTLGIIFLVSSALVYFLFLVSWLNLAVFLNKVSYIRLGISLIAIVFGGVSVFKFFNQKDDGCEVVDSKNRKRIINSIKKIVKEKSYFLAILGIIVLAVSVNIIELLCSLGLPVMFTQILSINSVSSTGQILYSLLYILFFLIDDIIIFVIAMKTLEIKAISNKFGKYSHLIGGIIMVLIGALMLFKPEWLMFNF